MAYRNLASYIRKILIGMRAFTVQFYDEANRKNGTQWTTSRGVPMTNGQKIYSIIKTGTMPVDLKAREFTYTGKGLIARFYTGFTPQTLPTPETVYNARPAFPASRDFNLYAIAAAPLSLGTRWNSDLFVRGNSTNQGEGNPDVKKGQGWVIDANTEVLLEIESLDAQDISATLVMYNGFLDLPAKD